MYTRQNIAQIEGYTPGEQPGGRKFIKLNTNENPYPPSPKVAKALRSVDAAQLRLYPNPAAQEFREEIATQRGVTPDNVICGNGSDDLLTIAVRTFVDQGGAIAYPNPSYSLYPVLGNIQGARLIEIDLDDDFQLPPDPVAKAADARLLFLARPNAPTGNAFPIDAIRELADEYEGVLFIDEAYADFGEDDCVNLIKEFPNVVVSRTLSKSYSLAGIRFGYAFADANLINEMFKVKDSYNVNAITQELALAAVQDQVTFDRNVKRVRESRARITTALNELGFETPPSQANFIFTKPPLDARHYLRKLREAGILIRYFPYPRISEFVRITVGTENEMDALLEATKSIVNDTQA
ncbi:MAG: histidinol-phosphate transaminase [Lentisphaeria bacterium]